MKKLFIIVSLFVFASCAKEQECYVCERERIGIGQWQFNYKDTISICGGYKEIDTIWEYEVNGIKQYGTITKLNCK